MTSQQQDIELIEAVDKILHKSFDEIRKKVMSLITKREKKVVREVHTSRKAPPKAPPKTGSKIQKKEREEEPKARHKKESYHRSQSSGSESSN
jgi:DNA-directed RNA polymerase subunit M/transcription elongation factor TFIIS